MIKGFTLVELLVALAIISVLSAIGFTTYSVVQKNNRDQVRLRDLNTFKQALELYRHDNHSYPQDLSDAAFSTYLETQPQDPLSPTFIYRYLALSSTNGSCNTSAKDCVNYVLCAKHETNKTFNFPSQCIQVCTGNPPCDMGISSNQ